VDLARGRCAGEWAPLTDGNPETWWAADQPTTEIVIEWGENAELGGIRLEEAIQFGQRVEAFAVDARKWGGWFEVARGTTIGAQSILDLTPISADAIRIRILASQAAPVLSRIMVYAG
jgi:alpha-L-fucosidase